MLIGVPKEIKNHEYRVGLTPSYRSSFAINANIISGWQFYQFH